MSNLQKLQGSLPILPKVRKKMSRRMTTVTCLIGAAVLLLGALPAASASAASPWWQVLTGSRPTNLWEPTDNVQEIDTEVGSLFGFEGVAAKVEVNGEVIGCLGTAEFPATFLCENEAGFPAEQTASQLEARLEVAFGTSAVEVTGGPVDGAPFVVTTPDQAVPSIDVSPILGFGSAAARAVSAGGSGRLVLTLTNLGDASVDGTSSPVRLVDKLPAGVVATGVEAVAGFQGRGGPISCLVEASDEVVCSFDGILTPYEAIEVEIFVSLTGSPPTAGDPGEVVVSGGGAAAVSVVQAIKVSPEPTPFGVEHFLARAEEEGGGTVTQAGAHPFQFTTTLQLNSGPVGPGNRRNAIVEQPALPRNIDSLLPVGLVGNATATPKCTMADFVDIEEAQNKCTADTVVGVSTATVQEVGALGLLRTAVPVFNLPPAPGEPARFGFVVVGDPVLIDTAVDPEEGYRITGMVHNVTQVAAFLSGTLSLWGTPGDPRHDNARGWDCLGGEGYVCARPVGLEEKPLLRMPVSCDAPLHFDLAVEPWNVPLGTQIERASVTGDRLTGCNRVPFSPSITAAPTSRFAGGPSGLTFELSMPNSGLLDGEAIAEGQAKKVEVTLPEGMTVNPSAANGLGACTPSEYGRETFKSGPGEGCPESSKIGSVDIVTPLLEEEAHGSVYVAAPYDNPFGSLLALYIVAKVPERGILVKQAGKVVLNPATGQLVTTFDDLPQIPFSRLNLRFDEGDRAPLVLPSACSAYDIVAKFTPWNAADPDNPQPNEIVTRTSSFTVDHGGKGGPCPSGTPPFKPGFVAGTVNNAAGKYSPLNVRLTREDDEQEFTRFSLRMPKGLIGKLAGIPFCPEAGIAAARSRTGIKGGQEELDRPSCPEASQIGRTLVGAGVGPTLTYAPGKLYLAGPYKGSKLSIVAVTTATVGPFDLGTVVIRQGLKVDPETAEVSTDGATSDPIPHILQGIIVHARDIRVYVDRSNFILNPTSCERMSAAASVLGSGLDFGSTADDQRAEVTAPFQAADCARLGFKPRLSLSLRGKTRRGGTPRLRAVVTARKHDANIGAAQVTLPHSEFLEQAHIRTVCTRVQFAAGAGNGSQCPKGSIYGRATALSPLLDERLVGPVYLRSSNHPLPDLVAALHTKKVDIDLVGRIDALNGGIRTTFEAVPDAPVTKFVLEMQGGKKGLLVNSTNICRGKHRATATFTGQNGKRQQSRPLVKARCSRQSRHRHKH
jgi:hypothetical protein